MQTHQLNEANRFSRPTMTSDCIRLLLVEDSEEDACLLYSELHQTSAQFTFSRVDCAEDMRAALAESEWDIVISDHSMPRFSSLEALNLLRECGKDIPFIIYSGDVSDHVEVAAMCSGAQDSITKGNFARLFPAMEREIRNAAMRRAREQADAHVHKLAFYDSLTGLPNSNMFLKCVSAKVLRPQGNFSTILVLNVDQFRRINNCYGHKIGEALICQIAQRLQQCVPDHGMVARSCRDEFVVFLDNALDAQMAHDGAEQIRQVLSRPFVEDAQDLQITVSIGIALSQRDGEDVPGLLIRAESAMQRAKSRGGNNCQLYVAEIGAAAGEQLRIESALRKAVSRQELFLEYRPKMNAATGAMTGLEAWVLWNHPERGQLEPDNFIPLANESGLICEIGTWVLHNACRQAKYWHDTGHAGLTIAVKVSAAQFLRSNLVQTVAGVLAHTGIEPHCLELEITESTLMRCADTTVMTLQALKRLQVKISVANFGAGHSSLGHLTRFPVDSLKIDKLFSRAATRDVGVAVIVKAIGTMASGLGLATVVEGVESVDQLDFLRQQFGPSVQSFLLSAPRSVADIAEMLETRLTGQDVPQRGTTPRGLGVRDRVGQILTKGFSFLTA